MAAFRARNLEGRLGFAVVETELITGFDCCASASLKLTVCFCCCPELVVFSYWSERRGGRVLFTSGGVPAIEVSGMLAFRGGGGAESRE